MRNNIGVFIINKNTISPQSRYQDLEVAVCGNLLVRVVRKICQKVTLRRIQMLNLVLVVLEDLSLLQSIQNLFDSNCEMDARHIYFGAEIHLRIQGNFVLFAQ